MAKTPPTNTIVSQQAPTWVEETMGPKAVLETLGRSGTSIYSGYISEEDNPKLTGTTGMETYNEMRTRSPDIATLLKIIKLPLTSTRWFIDPASGEKEDIEIAEFIEYALFEENEQGFTALLEEILTFLEFGFSLFEQVYKVDDKGRITLKKLWFRKQSTIQRWEMSDGAPGVTQQLPAPIAEWEGKGDTQVDIPSTKLLRFTYNQEGENYEGISLLRPIYGNYFAIDKLVRYDLIRSERLAMPIPTIYMPKGATPADMAAAKILVKEIKASERAGVVMPGSKADGWELVFTAVNGRDGADLAASIRMHQDAIYRIGLAQFILLWSGQSWSYALSEDQSDLFLVSLQSIGNYICNIINKYIVRRMVDFNYNVKRYPRLCFDKLGSVDVVKLSTTLSNLLSSGAITKDAILEDFVRTQTWLPKKEESDITEEEPVVDEPKDEQDVDEEDNAPEVEEVTDKELQDEEKKYHEHAHEDMKHMIDQDYIEYSQLFTNSVLERLQSEAATADDIREIKKKGFQFNVEEETSRRPLTFAERKVNWKKLKTDAAKLEKQVVDGMADYGAKLKSDVLAKVKRAVDNNDWDAVSDIAGKYKVSLTTLLSSVQKNSFDLWKEQAAVEMGKGVKIPPTSKDTVANLKLQRDAVAGKIASDVDTLTKKTVSEMAQKSGGIKNVPASAAVSAVSDILDKIITKATANIKTLAVTGAINMGRTNIYERYPEEVESYQYSAILDDVTTAICMSLDGRVVKAWSPEFYKYSPPRHYNCRSVWVGVLRNEAFKPKITGIPSSIPADASIDLMTKLDAPILLPDSPSIKIVREEIKQRKETLAQLEESGLYPNRQKQHKDAIDKLETALSDKFYEVLKDHLKSEWVKFKK